MQRAFQHHRTGIVAPALSRRFLASSNRNRITPASGTRGLSTSPNQNMFSEFQEIEVVGTSLNKSGAIVEVTTRGGGTEIVGANIDTALAGDTAGIETLLVQAAQDAYEQTQYQVKRKLIEISMQQRRKRQLDDKAQVTLDLDAVREK